MSRRLYSISMAGDPENNYFMGTGHTITTRHLPAYNGSTSLSQTSIS
ncbi:MAG: hypothetical protein ACR2NK_07480 [Mariniblastus sp.]